jgi:Flp pilus assembly secretin CpaC
MSVALLCSCSARRPELHKDLAAKIAQLREDAKTAVTAGIDRQVISPEEEAAARAARATTQIGPNAPIWIQSGKSRILTVTYPIQRVSITDPELASIVVLGPYTVMINAKPVPQHAATSGVAGGGVNIQMGGLPGVSSGGILTAPLPAEPHVAETTLAIWGAGRGPDVHTLTVADFIDQQVMLEVTIAEVNRTAMEQHGIDFRILQNDFFAASFMGAGSLPGVFPGTPLLPLITTGGTGTPTYAFVLPNEDAAAFITALQTEGLASILAQPKLLAMSGQNALFQAGGEIPIVQSNAFNSGTTFKPFGTLVNFIPRVSEDGDIMLTVTPEVSQPDFSRVVLGSPIFKTRRASTSARLRNGQTLVIGGLLQTLREETVKGVPYFKDIPFLGYLFRNTSYSDAVTELMVIVKVVLVHPLPPGTQLPLPTDRGPLKDEDIRTKHDPAEATRPRIPGVP